MQRAMERIPKRETMTVEFKSDRGNGYPDEALVDEIVGMANSEGGSLYLGVEDDGTVTGLCDKHKDSIGLTAMIANRTRPSLSVRSEIISVGDKNVMVVAVPKSFAVMATVTGKILRRRLKMDGEPESVPMYPYEIASRLSDLRRLDFSGQPVAGATPDDFSPAQFDRLHAAIGKLEADRTLQGLSDGELTQALRLTATVDGVTYPTLTGLLILGKEERLSELVPTAKADFQVLQGTKVVINGSYLKPLLELMEIFDNFFRAWNPEEEQDKGLFRIPIPAFSPMAFREAVANAFVHRDYSMLGNVRIQINDEGMTVSSPGGFVDGVTLNNILTAEPYGRNPTLSDALKRIGLVERTGRGVDRIFSGSIMYGRPWPDYTESTSREVVLFLPRSKADGDFMRLLEAVRQKQGSEPSIYMQMILSALRKNAAMSQDMLAQTTNLPLNRLLPALETLRGQGFIISTGYGKLYRLAIISTAQKQEKPAEAEKLIIELAHRQSGFVTKKDVSELLQTSEVKAYRYLQNLCKSGKMVLAQGGKYAKYRLVKEGAK